MLDEEHKQYGKYYKRQLHYLNHNTSKNNLITALKELCEFLDPDDEMFNKVMFGDFYYTKWLKQVSIIADDLISKGEKLNELNNSEPEEKKILSFYIEKLNGLLKSKYKSPKASTPELKSFFADDVKEATIINLQQNFKDLKGKEMAILIHLLCTKNMIEIDNNDRKGKSRIFFVRRFKEFHLRNINGINNFILPDSYELKGIGTKDIQYKDIKMQLDKIVSNG